MWEAPIASGTADRWMGKGFGKGQSIWWTPFAQTTFDGTTLQVWIFPQTLAGTPDFTATVTGQSFQTNPDPVSGGWTATRAPDDTLT